MLVLSSPIPHWVEPIKKEIAKEKELQDLVERSKHGEAIGPWCYKFGLIFYKDCIYLKSDSPFIKGIIHEFNCGSREGFNKMYHHHKAVFLLARGELLNQDLFAGV